LAYPFRLLLQRNDGVYFPTETIPSRFVGINAGLSSLHFNEDTATLIFNGEPGLEALITLALLEPDGYVSSTPEVDSATAWWWQISFYLGGRFSTQNTLLHSRSDLAVVGLATNGNQHRATSELNLWEYAGSFRYDLRSGALRPYLKAGYGWTWYRSEKTAVNGELLPTPDGEWINRPSLDSFSDILPNSWHAGAGLELLTYRSGAPFPHGVDVSLVGEVTYTSTSLGIDDWLRVAGSGDLSDGLIEELSFQRWTWSLGLTLGF
jgi:hypothetical protein